MEITFLGTGSAYPSSKRGASALAICFYQSHSSAQWLFDCGEGTQIQIQRCAYVKITRIRRIFISHLHGDHLFGLPGLLCSLACAFTSPPSHTDNLPEGEQELRESKGGGHKNKKKSERGVASSSSASGGGERGGGGGCDDVIEIYGPRGLRRYLRTSLYLSKSHAHIRYRVHEICFEQTNDDDDAINHVRGGGGGEENSDAEDVSDVTFWGECPGGAQLRFPEHDDRLLRFQHDENTAQTLRNQAEEEEHNEEEEGAEGARRRSIFVLEDEGVGGARVWAIPLRHAVPSLGWIVSVGGGGGGGERHLLMDKVLELGIPRGPLLRELKLGRPITLDAASVASSGGGGEARKEEGLRVVHPDDVLSPPDPSLLVCVMGDSCDSSQLVHWMCKAAANQRAANQRAAGKEREKEREKAANLQLDLLIHEATLSSGKRAEAILKGHSTPDMIAQWIAQIDERAREREDETDKKDEKKENEKEGGKEKREELEMGRKRRGGASICTNVVLTHFSQRFVVSHAQHAHTHAHSKRAVKRHKQEERNEEEEKPPKEEEGDTRKLVAELISAGYSGNALAAHDFMRLRLDKHGVLTDLSDSPAPAAAAPPAAAPPPSCSHPDLQEKEPLEQLQEHKRGGRETEQRGDLKHAETAQNRRVE